jgi:hypothetical protein
MTIDRAKLSLETGTVRFGELQRLFSRGCSRKVHAELDLVDVGCKVAADDTALLQEWLERSRIETVSDDQARAWHAGGALLRAVVIKPWVLVQEVPCETPGNEP